MLWLAWRCFAQFMSAIYEVWKEGDAISPHLQGATITWQGCSTRLLVSSKLFVDSARTVLTRCLPETWSLSIADIGNHVDILLTIIIICSRFWSLPWRSVHLPRWDLPHIDVSRYVKSFSLPSPWKSNSSSIACFCPCHTAHARGTWGHYSLRREQRNSTDVLSFRRLPNNDVPFTAHEQTVTCYSEFNIFLRHLLSKLIFDLIQGRPTSCHNHDEACETRLASLTSSLVFVDQPLWHVSHFLPVLSLQCLPRYSYALTNGPDFPPLLKAWR